jgi:hypothetical protein
MISCSLQEIYTMFGFMNIVQGLAAIFVLSKLYKLKLHIRLCSVIAIFVPIVFDYYDNPWFKQYFILSKKILYIVVSTVSISILVVEPCKDLRNKK